MLPIFKSTFKEFMLMQTRWASEIDKVLILPWNHGLQVVGIKVVSGDNVINHKLGRPLQGWIVTRQQTAFVDLYDKQSTNLRTDLTLVLNSSGSGLIDLLVF